MSHEAHYRWTYPYHHCRRDRGVAVLRVTAQDPSLRIAALTIVGNAGYGYSGDCLHADDRQAPPPDVTHQDLPPNSSMQQTTTLQTKTPPDPPVTPPPLTPLASQVADASKETK